MHSGVGTMGKEIVLGTAHHFNWVNLGAAVKHPEEGKVLDLSQQVNKETDIDDAYVRLVPYTGYGNVKILRELIEVEKPDALMIFTDPRYWLWLFEIEREIRSKIPIFWLNIWDDYPAPMYNKPYYESVDVLMAISKQTKNINEIVLGDKAKNKIIEYVPHGINEKHYYPIKQGHEDFMKLEEVKKTLLNKKGSEFVLFYNSRNISRKHTADTIFAYKMFCDRIGKEKAKKCTFILHTDGVDQHGTDLRAVRDAICDPDYVHVAFSTEKVETAQLNVLYNIADATILLSSNEGWGLALTESLMAGTMIIANVTGGMQDQMRFTDKDGAWANLTPDFPSNHRGTLKDCGEWAVPVFPSNISLAGSPITPYIFDDRCSPKDAADKIFEVYSLSKTERDERGFAGHEWVRGDEARMTARKMGQNVIETLDKGFDEFVPRKSFELYTIGEFKKDNKITHKLINY